MQSVDTYSLFINVVEYYFIYYENRTQSTSKKKTNTDRKKDTKIQTHT